MNCQKKRYLGIILVLVLLMLCLVIVIIGYCPHRETYTKVVKEANCFTIGQIDTICKRCENILESNTLKKTSHEFSEYKLTVRPSTSNSGEEVRICYVCLKEETREYCCPHEETFNKVIKEATCYEYGQIDTICNMCEVVLVSNSIEIVEHTFSDYELIVKPSVSKSGIEARTCVVCLKQETREYFCTHEVNLKEEWQYIKYATPFEAGERYRNCYLCGTKLSQTYTIPALEKNSIYITGTDIRHGFVISSFTQSSVDKYDIVYSEDSDLGENNAFILGHSNRTLCMLDQTKIGAHIYINKNGTIEKYEVVVSEYGLLNTSRMDIIGQTTGTSIWQQYESKTLHIYTCYGINPYGRWIVLARKVT